jgi:sodium-dependent phosphate cotransporter
VGAWPPALLFVAGVALLAVSFKVLDAMVPAVDETRLRGSRLTWLQGKWPMFALGIVVVIATLSVSVALTVLVPLVAKGYVKRDNLIPYIVGADLGTLVDKLLVAFLVGIGAAHPDAAVRIILAEIIGTATVGVIVMAFLYGPFKHGMWRFQRRMTSSKASLLAFTAALFLVPLATIGISGLAG